MSLKRAVFLVALMVGFGFFMGWMGNDFYAFHQENKAQRERDIAEVRQKLSGLDEVLDGALKVLEYDRRTYPYAGFGFAYTGGFVQAPLGEPQKFGVVVHSVVAGSKAHAAGLVEGFQITAIDGVPVGDLGPDAYRDLSNDQLADAIKPQMDKVALVLRVDSVALTVRPSFVSEGYTIRLKSKTLVGQELHDFAQEHLERWQANEFDIARVRLRTVSSVLDEAVKQGDGRRIIQCRQQAAEIEATVNPFVDEYLAFRESQFVRGIRVIQ